MQSLRPNDNQSHAREPRAQRRHRRISTSTILAAIGALVCCGAGAARADTLAAYLEGHGGLSSGDSPNRTATTTSSSGSGLAPGLGFQVGARLLLLEGYYDRTAFGSGASITRGIV